VRLSFIEVGYTQKPHGLKGEVKAVFYYSFLPEKELKNIFLGNVSPLPYFIEHLHLTGKKNFLLKVKDCNDRDHAEQISGKKIHVTSTDFEAYFEPDDASALIGYKVFTGGKILGHIEDVFQLPQQFLAQVFIEEKEVLIPLNEKTIVKVDPKKKTLVLRLPDGLLDI